MDQKEIEERLKNFQVKHIEKPEKRKNSHYPIMKAFASSGNMRRKSSLESEESGKNPNGEDICEAYDLRAKCLEGQRLFYRNYQHRRGNFPVPEVRYQPDHSALRQ